MPRNIKQQQSGVVVVTVLVLTIFFSFMLLGMTSLAQSSLYRARDRVLVLQAQYAAESGVDSVIAVLNSGNTSYTGTSSPVTLLNAQQYKATYTASVAAGSDNNEKIVTATGNLYAPASSSSPTQIKSIKVVVQRNSTQHTTGILGRDIIYIGSGVKNIYAKDIFANDFIWVTKSTSNLIGENITVGGRYDDVNSCSIGGSGKLVKPTTFYTPGQTKTNIITAYNNCLSPPGNTTNSNFTVQANQTNISPLSSTYIPWSQYMDSGSPTAQSRSCTDFTSGSFPRSIPTSGSLPTHYPDTGSGVNITCGLVGDVHLNTGQYNITQNVHIRASLCLVIACTPTFYNPDSSTVRWVFVEGQINFASVNTASGSGPIIFVAYGSDPLTHLLDCPYGGSVFIGNTGTTAAPATYFIAQNGLCVSKTKFSASPALGGVSGKNIYIDSNPGTPFDLSLDPLFPVNQIPINLAWRAMYYERL